MSSVKASSTSASDGDVPCMTPPITCKVSESLKVIIGRLNEARVHRLYIVNDLGDCTGVVTLRDIIGTFVVEPEGYFGELFGNSAASLVAPPVAAGDAVVSK